MTTNSGNVHGPIAALSALLICLGGACATAGARAVEVDCGVDDAGYDRYDPAGRECFWKAYTSKRSVRWAVTQRTIEGDPITTTLTYEPAAGLTVDWDTRADRFAGQGRQRVWSWSCQGLTLAADTASHAFGLWGCQGEGARTHFP